MTKGMPDAIQKPLMWTIGLAVIAFVLLIMVIIFGNLSGNVGFGQTSTTFYNETVALNDTAATPPTANNRVNGALSGVIVTNATGGETVPATNYTVVGVTIVAATGNYNGTNVNVTATVTYDTQGKIDSDNVITNYTTSATNTSAQFPTVGTIIGIAILLAILIGVLVMAVVRIMKAANAASGGYSGGSSRFGNSKSDYA